MPDLTIERDKEVREIHKTEFVDKALPTILYEKRVHHSLTEGHSEYILVSDKTSEKALKTFKRVREEVKK